MPFELEPLDPDTAVELYLKHRKDDCADSTINAHRLRLGHFVRWCEDVAKIDNLNELTGRKLHEYRLWRKEDGELNRVSVRTQMSTLRVFIRFCETIDGVRVDLHEAVDIPELDKGENARSVHIENDRAQRILERLRMYEYASMRHALVLLLWRTAIRTGTLRAIDVGDVDIEENHIEIRHRPETDTPLKNKNAGQRFLAISERAPQILSDWLEERHPGTNDEYGRTPLIATKQGRISRSNIRKNVYWATAPQFVGDECACDIDEHPYAKIHECEDAVSPHALRRGAITHHLRSDVPKPVVGGRANVSSDVLDKHYNEVTLKEEMSQRRGYLDSI